VPSSEIKEIELLKKQSEQTDILSAMPHEVKQPVEEKVQVV